MGSEMCIRDSFIEACAGRYREVVSLDEATERTISWARGLEPN